MLLVTLAVSREMIKRVFFIFQYSLDPEKRESLPLSFTFHSLFLTFSFLFEVPLHIQTFSQSANTPIPSVISFKRKETWRFFTSSPTDKMQHSTNTQNPLLRWNKSLKCLVHRISTTQISFSTARAPSPLSWTIRLSSISTPSLTVTQTSRELQRILLRHGITFRIARGRPSLIANEHSLKMLFGKSHIHSNASEDSKDGEPLKNRRTSLP